MTAVRKIIGLVIILFFGLPTLFGVIWVVGLTKATVSAEFLSDLPREIIEDVPDMAEEIFRDAQDEGALTDENLRAWFKAAADAGITPRQVMEETGLLDWLQEGLSASLAEVGEIFRGERRARSVVLDLRPLKEILMGDDFDRYMMRILDHLPPCDEGGQRKWRRIAEETGGRGELPACRPDEGVVSGVLAAKRAELVEEIDDEVEIIEDLPYFPYGLSRTVTFLSSFLFLLPAFFIVIGSLIAASSPAGFFRWSGVSALAGGIPALLLALLVRSATLWGVGFVPYSFSDYGAGSSELGNLVLERAGWIPATVLDHLFSPVVTVAAMVCVVGVVVFTVSFLVRGGSRKT